VTQTRNSLPLSPKQAAERWGAIDTRLNPEWFKAIGDPTRVQLLACLMKCGRPCTVGEIAECCDVDLSVVSRHLQILQRVGVLASTKSGRSVSYVVRYGDICQTLRLIIEAIEQCCPQPCRNETCPGEHAALGACCRGC